MDRYARGFTSIFCALALVAVAYAATPPAQTQFARSRAEDIDLHQNPAIAEAYGYWRVGAFSDALALLRPLAERGDPAAQFLMGEFCSRGEGVDQNDEQAASWWRRAAEQGFAFAQNEIGVALTDGRGVPLDPRQAVGWYQKAADQGMAVAQVNLGSMYLNGLGVRRDERKAVDWYRRAADQGLGWGQYFLANAYASGRGVSKDNTQALKWYRAAADQGFTDAAFALGSMYFDGAGVLSDNSRAAYWFASAARDGHETAQKVLKVLAPALSRMPLAGGTRIMKSRDPDSQAITTTREPGYAYVLERGQGWIQVYLEDGHTVGYVQAMDSGR